jgi:hypothetical protein
MRDLMPHLSPDYGYRFPSTIGIPQMTPHPFPFGIEASTNDRGVINGGRLFMDEGARRIEIHGNTEGGDIKWRIPVNIP